MTWPTLDEYREALSHPESALRDPSLRGCRFPDRDARGWPVPVVGTFAAVFRATGAADGRDRAIRVFLKPPDRLASRYEVAGRHLAAGRPRAMVAFHFDADGLRLPDGRSVPLVAMDWVSGPTLSTWTRERCLAGDSAALRDMGDRWDRLLGELDAAGIAHGDLEARNVLVDDRGELRLIDYDVLCVPALAGRPAPELGMKLEGNPCQHPGRHAATILSPAMDTFAALVLRLELRALADQPGLWGRFGPPAATTQLVTVEDLVDPARSRLFESLFRSEDAEVRRMAEVVSHLYEFPLDSLPPLRELLAFGPRPRYPDELLADPAQLLVEFPTLTSGERAMLEKHARASPPPPSFFGLEPSPIRKGLESSDRGRSYAARWIWAGTGLPGHCLLAVCPRRPGGRDGPESVETLCEWRVNRGEHQPFPIHPEESWTGGYVAVWGVIDLGTARFHTAPLVLGQIGGGSGSSFLGRLLGGRRGPASGGGATPP